MNSLLRIAQLSLALVLIGTSGLSSKAGSASFQSVDQDVATNRALGKVPAGKTVTDTSCEEKQAGGIGGETHYRCTVTWD